MREHEYREFFDSTTEALSPVHLLDSSIFACWTEDTRKSFGPVFHELFLATTGVREQVENLHRLLTESLRAVNIFLETPARRRTGKGAGAVLATLDRLSSAISALPGTIAGLE